MIDGLRSRAAERDERPAAPSRGGLGRWLARHHVSADVVTVAGLLLSALTAVLIGAGWLWPAVVALTVGGLMDTLDGAVAKAAGSSSRRGAFFDSVADRIADAMIFAGVAWYLVGGHDPRLALLPLAVLGVSAVVSYERAKAESLGLASARGGLMERAERLILLGVGLGFHVVLVPVLWVLLVLTVATAAGRFARVWREASRSTAAGEVPARVRTWRPARVESRWRSWRETGRVDHVGAGAARTRMRERRTATMASSRRTSRLREVLGSPGATTPRRSGRDRRVSTGAFRRRYDSEG